MYRRIRDLREDADLTQTKIALFGFPDIHYDNDQADKH